MNKRTHQFAFVSDIPVFHYIFRNSFHIYNFNLTKNTILLLHIKAHCSACMQKRTCTVCAELISACSWAFALCSAYFQVNEKWLELRNEKKIHKTDLHYAATVKHTIVKYSAQNDHTFTVAVGMLYEMYSTTFNFVIS